IESRVQTLAANLTNDRRLVSAVVVGAIDLAVGILVGPANTFSANAAVRIRSEHAALLVDCQIVEVEQIARTVRTGSAVSANNTALHWIIRRRVRCYPSHTAVVCRRDVAVPGARKRKIR